MITLLLHSFFYIVFCLFVCENITFITRFTISFFFLFFSSRIHFLHITGGVNIHIVRYHLIGTRHFNFSAIFLHNFFFCFVLFFTVCWICKSFEFSNFLFNISISLIIIILLYIHQDLFYYLYCNIHKVQSYFFLNTYICYRRRKVVLAILKIRILFLQLNVHIILLLLLLCKMQHNKSNEKGKPVYNRISLLKMFPLCKTRLQILNLI